MKGLNLASSVKGLLTMAGLIVLGLICTKPQAMGQALTGSSDIDVPFSKNSMNMLANANFVEESEAVQVLFDARNQQEAQAASVTTKAAKWGVEVRVNYYLQLIKSIKEGSNVQTALVNTYGYLEYLCQQTADTVDPESVFQETVMLLSN